MREADRVVLALTGHDRFGKGFRKRPSGRRTQKFMALPCECTITLEQFRVLRIAHRQRHSQIIKTFPGMGR
jgi:hypothetical protein